MTKKKILIIKGHELNNAVKELNNATKLTLFVVILMSKWHIWWHFNAKITINCLIYGKAQKAMGYKRIASETLTYNGNNKGN